jgi:hypothetical protein
MYLGETYMYLSPRHAHWWRGPPLIRYDVDASIQ